MMRTIQQRYYVPNNSALVLTGDVNPADVIEDGAGVLRRLAEARERSVRRVSARRASCRFRRVKAR